MLIIGANPDGTLVCEVTRDELKGVTDCGCWFSIKLLEPGDKICLKSIAGGLSVPSQPLVTKSPLMPDDAADRAGGLT